MASSDLEAATALKAQGNKAFAQHEWPAAIDFYTQAIEKYDKEPTFFSNRAQVCRAAVPGSLASSSPISLPNVAVSCILILWLGGVREI